MIHCFTDETHIVDVYVSVKKIGISKVMKQRVASKKLKEILTVKREKRAQMLASSGLVDRIDDYFRVSSPGAGRPNISFEVKRDEIGQVRCTCLEFEETHPNDPAFICEHIMAVKFAIRLRNTEPVTKKVNNTESRASTRGEQKRKRLSADHAGHGHTGVKTATAGSFENIGEKEMKKNGSGEMPLADVVEEYKDVAQTNILNFSSTLRELRKTLDPQLVKQREGWTDRNGNPHMVDYIEWHTVADILDQTASNWAHTVKEIRPIGNIMTVTVAITIDGVTREGIGTGPIDSEMGIKKAEHDALKRAAVKFGIARDLYKREFEAAENNIETAESDVNGFPANPIARSLSDLVTARQLGMIRAIAREIGLDADRESSAVMRCKTDELSKRAASALIVHLQDIQKTGTAPAAMPLPRAA